MHKLVSFWLLLTGLFVLSFNFSCKKDTFDGEAWRAWEESETNGKERWDMAKSLVRSDRLIGLSREEVVVLLGEDHSPRSNPLGYNTGPCQEWRVISIDWSSLNVYFTNGQVSSVKHSCH